MCLYKPIEQRERCRDDDEDGEEFLTQAVDAMGPARPPRWGSEG